MPSVRGRVFIQLAILRRAGWLRWAPCSVGRSDAGVGTIATATDGRTIGAGTLIAVAIGVVAIDAFVVVRGTAIAATRVVITRVVAVRRIAARWGSRVIPSSGGPIRCNTVAGRRHVLARDQRGSRQLLGAHQARLHAGFTLERLVAAGRGVFIERLAGAQIALALRLLGRASFAGIGGAQAALGGPAQLCQSTFERLTALRQSGADIAARGVWALRLAGVDRPLALSDRVRVTRGERLERRRCSRRG